MVHLIIIFHLDSMAEVESPEKQLLPLLLKSKQEKPTVCLLGWEEHR
jgi:hypothetical protein